MVTLDRTQMSASTLAIHKRLQEGWDSLHPSLALRICPLSTPTFPYPKSIARLPKESTLFKVLRRRDLTIASIMPRPCIKVNILPRARPPTKHMRIPKLLPAVRTPRLSHRGPLLQTLSAEVSVPAGEAYAGAFGVVGGEGAVADCAVWALVGDVGLIRG
jgi:hypothetical protein